MNFPTMMRFPTKLFFSALLFSAIFSSKTTQAEPWIDTSDLYLKAYIQLLSDSGYITSPITTYPLMWHDIIKEVKNIDTQHLSQHQQNAYYYIRHQFSLAKKNQVRIKAQASNKDNRFTSFGDTYRDKNSVQLQISTMSDNVAIKFAPSYTFSPEDGKEIRLDDSYIAAFVGNWVFSFGQQDRWYGPSWDSSLSLSNNARPIPAFSVSRKSAIPFAIPFTDIKMPWTVSSFMGRMNDDRVVNNTLLWGFRFNVKPLDNLEIGLTRLAQWGGDGRSKSLSTFGNILIGKTNCGIDDLVCNENSPNPANQQAGYDIRYTFRLFDLPISFYGSKFAEDGSEGTFNYLTKAQPQVGFDTHLNLFSFPSTVYIEASDTLADCGLRDSIGDCYYEHSSYATGMRYNLRSIGSAYDNDAKTYVLGAISQLDVNTRMIAKLRYLQLNSDNQDKAPNNPIIGNPVTAIAEDVWLLSTSVQHNYQNWRFTLDADISQSTFENDIANKTKFNASLTVEYNL